MARPNRERFRRRNRTAAYVSRTGMPSAWPPECRKARPWNSPPTVAEVCGLIKCFLDMLGVFAEFETNLRKERQLEGIAKAKAAGVYKGRPASIDAAQVQQLKAEGMGPSQIAKHLGIGRASVYRALEANENRPHPHN